MYTILQCHRLEQDPVFKKIPLHQISLGMGQLRPSWQMQKTEKHWNILFLSQNHWKMSKINCFLWCNHSQNILHVHNIFSSIFWQLFGNAQVMHRWYTIFWSYDAQNFRCDANDSHFFLVIHNQWMTDSDLHLPTTPKMNADSFCEEIIAFFICHSNRTLWFNSHSLIQMMAYSANQMLWFLHSECQFLLHMGGFLHSSPN